LSYIVSANLPIEYLRSFWMDAPITSTAAIGLMRDNGYLVSRFPVPANLTLEQVYGRPRTGALINHLQKEGFPEHGYVQGPSSLDGPDFMNAFRRLPNHYVTLFVALPMSAVRAAWFDRVSTTYIALLLLSFAGFAAYRYAKRRELDWNNEQSRLEDAVRQMAFHDALTGLPNRRLLLDRLTQVMGSSKRTGRYAAIIFLDLDNFKPLNDAHGHDVGDLLLIEAACRLTNCVREIDTVARFGGDEFVVMLSDLNADREESRLQAHAIVEKIRVTLSEPYPLTVRRSGKPDVTVTHHCTASIGIALFSDHEDTGEDILKWADDAMFKAKDEGRNLVRFYEEAKLP